MATHSSTLAWKIPWMEEPDRLQSMGPWRVGHNWATWLPLFTFMRWRRKWQPTSVFLPGESQGRGAWLAAIYGVAQSRTRLQRLSSCSSDITQEVSLLLLQEGGLFSVQISSKNKKINVQFSSVVSDSLRPHGLQHARHPCPSPTHGVYSNSCPLSWWCHPTFSSSVIPFSSCLQSFPATGSLQMSCSLHQWPKYWSFSFNISPSNEYSGLISFRMDWLDLLAVQGTLKSLLHTTVQKHQFFGAQLL